MKKYCFIFVLAAVMLCCTAVWADAYSLEADTDYSEGVTTVCAEVGGEYADRRVNVVVLNPGFTAADLERKTPGAVNWAAQSSVSTDGSFSLSMKLEPAQNTDNTTYTAVAAVDTLNEILTVEFELYNQSYVDNVVEQIKAAVKNKDTQKIGSLLDEYAPLCGIDKCAEYGTFTAFDETRRNRTLNGIIEEEPNSAESFKTAFISAVSAVMLDDITSAEEYETALKPFLDRSAESVRKDFKNMSAEKKTKLTAALMETEFNSGAAVIDYLNKVLVLDPINSAAFWTESAEIYLSHSDVLNINTASYQKLKDKKMPVSSLLKRNFKTIEEAAKAFDDAVELQRQKESAQSGGNKGTVSGGSSGGGGKNSGNAFVVGKPVQQPEQTEEKKFTDLSGYEWAADDISYLADKGIVNGESEKSFAPERAVTRAEFVQIFVNAFALTGKNMEINFADVTPSDWFYESVRQACGFGYINGISDEYFAPNETVTREDMAVILNRYLNKTNENSLAFADSELVSDYAENAVAALSENKIINGYEDNTFRPKSGASRAEAAVLIARILKEGGKQ